MKSQLRSFRRSRVKKTACTVSAAALMLGVSHAATVAMHFQVNYCGGSTYSGFPVTMTAFGVAPSGWQNLMPMDTGYYCTNGMSIYTLSQTVSTNTSTGGLNPLPRGTINVTWSADGANFSGFAGYGGSPPSYAYNGQPPSSYPTGEWEIYNSFLRDGVNFGIDPTGTPSYTHCGDNTESLYNVDITGLQSVFSNPYVIELIASSDSMQTLTNAFIIDATANTTNSVTYPSTPFPFDESGTCNQWLRGHGGGLSTYSAAMNTDHIKITSNHPQHGGTGGPPTGFDNAGTISGFIITDKPVVTMSPQSVVAHNGDSVSLSFYAIGVPPLTYQWRRNGVAIPGATATSYSIPTVNTSSMGNYDVVVNNAYGTATSSESAVTDGIKEVLNNNLIADSNPANPERDGVNNGATWLASSSDGTRTQTGVMQFNPANTNGITVPGTTNFDSVTGTLMFWMRSPGTDTTNGGHAGGAIFGRPGGTFGGSLIVMEMDSGNVLFNAPGNNQVTSVANVADNNWHLIIATYDSSSAGGGSVYVDGVLDSTNANNGPWSALTGDELELGFSSVTGNTATEPYNGQLDDVRFYNRELSAAEVATVFATGGLIDTNALQMQFTFNTAPVSGLGLTWQTSGSVLQSAPAVNGTYSDVNAAVSPYYIIPKASQKFFRYRFTHTPQSLVSNPYLM